MEELKTFLDHGARIDNSLKDPNPAPMVNRQRVKAGRKRQRQARKAQGRDRISRLILREG